jgi:DNA-binding XRE family transcriptional regulator
MTQSELAQILGFLNEVPVSRHERSTTVPNLLTVFGYAIIFQVPISEIFPGLRHTVEVGIEERLAKLEEKLQQSTAKGRSAAAVARKLEFLCERNGFEPNEAAR